MKTLQQVACGFLTGVSTFAIPCVANAQTAGTGSAQDTRTASGQALLEEVVVTGSRVITNGNDSPTPVTVITVEQLQATHPATVFESLLDMPAFAGSRGGTSSLPANAGGSNGANNGQISALSLRGLGPVRTLVLYDGHRVPATQQNGLVNANTIPQMLLQRVDIVTGGASAVYGSDAIGGVVNFVTNRKFNGVKVDVQGGISERNDAGTWQAGVAFGTDLFGGRGHFMGSAHAFHDDGILHRNDRGEPFTTRWMVRGNGTAVSPYFLAPNGINTTATWGGKIVGPTGATNPLLNYHFANNGVASPFFPGSTNGGLITNPADRIGGDGFYFTESTLKSWSELEQLYARFDYDLSDDLHFFLTASGTLDHAFSYTNNANQFNAQLRSTNAYLPAAYQQQLLNAGIAQFGFSKVWGPGSAMEAQNADFYSRSLYVNTGLEGKLGEYNWEISYTRSDVENDFQNNWTPNVGRFFAAVDAAQVTAANVGSTGLAIGSIVCNVALTNPGLYPGCVPVNVFGPTSESQAAADYIRQQMEFVSKMPTDDVSGSIAGAPFDNWAGPVNMALSGEWRRQGFSMTSSAPTVNFAPLNCTGLTIPTGNCVTPTATNPGTSPFMGAVAPRPPVSMTVSEAALEADVPLLKDLPLVQAVDLNLAYRYAKYRVKGNADITAPNLTNTFNSNTWKVGLDWHFNDAVTLRATRSRDLRAPNLAELFQPISTTFGGGNTDRWTIPNTNLTPSGSNPAISSGGNARLQPEIASTTTVGLVFTPTPSFSVALDYFSIKIKDFIRTVGGFDAVIQDGCYAGVAEYCALQERPFALSFSRSPTVNSVTKWYTVPLNVAEMTTEGLDLEANFKTTLAGQPFSVRGLVTYQPHLLLKQSGAETQDIAGQYNGPINGTQARTRVTLFAHYNLTDNLAIDWQTRWRDRLHFTSTASQVALPSTEVSAVSYSSLNLGYQLSGPFSGQSSVFLNIQNVFNQPAPIAGGTNFPGNNGGFALGDDPIGRYYTFGVRARF